MLLQIMEEGKLTDAKGRQVDFSNAIIVMTSNIGAKEIRQSSLGFQLQRDEELEERIAYQEMRRDLTKKLKKVFRPEFINRLDNVVVFRALNEEDITTIAELEVNKVADRLIEQAITLDVTPVAVELIANLGYDPNMGARPLRRVIQQHIEEPLSDAILAGEFKIGDTILVDAGPGEDEEDKIILRHPENHDESPSAEKGDIVAAA